MKTLRRVKNGNRILPNYCVLFTWYLQRNYFFILPLLSIFNFPTTQLGKQILITKLLTKREQEQVNICPQLHTTQIKWDRVKKENYVEYIKKWMILNNMTFVRMNASMFRAFPPFPFYLQSTWFYLLIYCSVPWYYIYWLGREVDVERLGIQSILSQCLRSGNVISSTVLMTMKYNINKIKVFASSSLLK